MQRPICDFVGQYRASGTARFHMPGHKGEAFLGCESLDLTEIQGADSLYEADGIIAESEQNASLLFGSSRTFYSTEGSSQCIRAMLYLALSHRKAGTPPRIVAARNVHKAFVYAAALLDFEVTWLWPEGDNRSICGCPVSALQLEEVLSSLPCPPAAVYITSPDYLGGIADVQALAETAHRHGTLLLVDNAHGAYLHFLTPSRHPLDLGADLCCDSAHKTLPVLTGGAYLHLSSRVTDAMQGDVRGALALFGSTSPSYLILQSLDNCNAYLSDRYPARLQHTCAAIARVRETLRRHGWTVEDTDPLRLTLTGSGLWMAQLLRENGMECEYADPESLVLMLTPETHEDDLRRLVEALGINAAAPVTPAILPPAKGGQVVSIRQALFSPHEVIPASQALGRICGAPTVACPPAIPIAVSGERIGEEAMNLFEHYHVDTVDVLK